MLTIKPTEGKPPPPMLEINTTQSTANVNALTTNGPHASPKSLALGPVVVLVARASDLHDHEYPGAIFDYAQMHAYLRGLLLITSTEHHKAYGSLAQRPQMIQTIVHAANHKMPVNCRTFKYLAAALEEARVTKSSCVFILYNWDGWTCDDFTISDLCEMYPTVEFSLHVYANGHGVAREFYEANAHLVSKHFRGRLKLEDESIVNDRNTALFIRVIAALRRVHDKLQLTPELRRELGKYDSRLN